MWKCSVALWSLSWPVCVSVILRYSAWGSYITCLTWPRYRLTCSGWLTWHGTSHLRQLHRFYSRSLQVRQACPLMYRQKSQGLGHSLTECCRLHQGTRGRRSQTEWTDSSQCGIVSEWSWLTIVSMSHLYDELLHQWKRFSCGWQKTKGKLLSVKLWMNYIKTNSLFFKDRKNSKSL